MSLILGDIGPCVFSPQDELEQKEEGSKSVNLELVFGYHWKAGTGKSVSLHGTHQDAAAIMRCR